MLSNTEAELQSVSQERDKYRRELATSQQTVGELNTCCLALRVRSTASVAWTQRCKVAATHMYPVGHD